MSTMKDYMMWLDDRGIAVWDSVIGELIIPKGVDIYADELSQEYSQDSEWCGISEPDDDEDLIETEDDEEFDVLYDDDDPAEIAWTPEEYWFHADGGLTGDAYDFLYNADIQGEHI